ncbi:tryptophan-rich sensory protein [Oscillatoria sp. FACHB-1407]|uniref:TspO/MBR family protein n=1 Tax=Oscillatoria sp. FACHB-1407 TaxID=2692847 RepID=UPI001686C37F|nr:tryptophan-rich sensory protein [Oscillatoria sp. FACHB-1407]MBD2460928.1 tryptophan-rich sensory protein [Oscillatoria sp. FACHB-1407]
MSIKPWMVIFGITILIAMGSIFIRPKDIPWEKRLDRPRWLFFEPLIPVIWMVVFLSGALSATLVWEQEPGSLKTWSLMGLYILTEIVTTAYIPATLRSRNLKVGLTLGAIGVALGVVLTAMVWQISGSAAALMLPYLIWSPVGTYATQQMMDLNPEATT